MWRQNYLYNKCYSLVNNTWVVSVNMTSGRSEAAAAQLKDGSFLVTGGIYKHGASLNTSEMFTERGWEILPSLPVTIRAHCMVTVNKTTVMVIGGVMGEVETSKKTFYFTFGEKSWSEGPTMKYARYLKSQCK